MPSIRNVAVFCGAQSGNNPLYRAAAEEIGRGLARSGIGIVFGGGRVGLMGAVADGALANGGSVVGIIPDFLMQREVAHEGVKEMTVTDSMHSRKRRMFDLSDAFIGLPGGLGTLDEVIEIITWRQLGLHDKPILLCDVMGSAAPIQAVVDAAIARGFAEPNVRDLFELTDGVPPLLKRLESLSAPPESKSARF